MTSANLKKLATGMTIDGVHYQPCKISAPAQNNSDEMIVARKYGHSPTCIVELHEGKNREIRKLFQACQCFVTHLVRIQYGPFGLSSRGQVNTKGLKKKF